MRNGTGRASDRRGPARAFTLVELMVVIVIIALLIGIVLPAVGRVREIAKNTASQSVIGSLTTALEEYKADGRIGGGYPPSWSDAPAGGNYGMVRSPYADLPGGSNKLQFPMTGAGLLVWALVGADQGGTPGFKPFRSTNTARQWWLDTDDENNGDNPTQSGAYALRSTDGQPLQTRSGQYVDVSSGRLSKWDRAGGRFTLEAETEADRSRTPVRDYPLFLDAFGFPILYWRADPAGVRIADQDPANLPLPQDRGIYHWIDNLFLLDAAYSNQNQLVLRPGAGDHRLDWGTGVYTPTNLPPFETFQRFIMDEAVQAKLAPQRVDSYLLVSPGSDGVYGSGDDITNFHPNGR